MDASFAMLDALMRRLGAQPHHQVVAVDEPGKQRLVSGVGMAEGWRGTIVHRIEVGPDRRIPRHKIVDPSFFNWPALPLALTNTIVPDFPIANKSFNLSYAGNDL